MNKIVCILISSLFLLSQIACTRTNINTTSPASFNNDFQNTGVLVSVFRTNVHTLTYNNLPWSRLIIERTDAGNTPKESHKGKLYSLNNLLTTGSHSLSIFSGVLPEGEYRIKKLEFLFGINNIWFDFPEKSNFTIKPNTVTDLGEIITHSTLASGNTRFINNPNKNMSKAYMKKYLPQLDKVLINLDRIQTDVIQLGYSETPIEHMKMDAMPSVGGLVDNEGQFYVGARFGQVLVRDKEQIWNNIDTGQFNIINDVYKTQDEMLLVGGELNFLANISNQSHVNIIDTSSLKIGSIVFVHYTKNKELLIAVQEDEETLFYMTKSLTNPIWDEIGKINGGGKWQGWLGEAIIKSIEDEVLIYTIDKDYYSIDFTNYKLTKLNPKKIKQHNVFVQRWDAIKDVVCQDEIFDPKWMHCGPTE